MKRLSEFINESTINESSINEKDFDKVDKILADNNKLKKFIKDNESDVSEFGLGSSDVDDIINAFIEIHSNLSEMSGSDIDFYLSDIEDEFNSNDVDCDESLILGARSLYLKLFKQIAGKSLTDDPQYTVNRNDSEMGRLNAVLNNNSELNKFLKIQNINKSAVNDLKQIYNRINKTVDPSDYALMSYDDFEWDDYKDDYEKNLKTPNSLELFKKLWKYSNK